MRIGIRLDDNSEEMIFVNCPRVSSTRSILGTQFRAELTAYQVRRIERYLKEEDAPFWIDLGERDIFRHRGELYYRHLSWWGGCH